MKNLCLFIILFLTHFSFGALQFTDEIFNRLDLSEMRSLRGQTPSENLILNYFEAEALFLEGKVHASQDLLDSLLGKCQEILNKNSGAQAQLTCLLARLGFSSSRHSLELFLNRQQVDKAVQALRRPDFSFEERSYLEGRLLWRLPSELGGNTGRSLLALESLYRLKPRLTAALFFMGQIYDAEGNSQLAERAYERALKADPPDKRAKLLMSEDGIHYSSKEAYSVSQIYYGVLSNPAGGTGLLIGKRDDRLWDTRRKLNASISAQSRSVFGARVFYEDGESFSPLSLKTQIVTFRERDQFFGLGPNTQLEDMSEILQSRTQVRFLIQKKLAGFHLAGGVGWILRYPSSFEGKTPPNWVLEPQASFALNMEMEGEPFDGSSVFLRSAVARKEFASTHTFNHLELGARQTVLEKWNQKIELKAFYRTSSPDGPLLNLSQLSGSNDVPGVRFGRFRDYQMGTLTGEWQIPLWRDFKFCAFGNLASLGKDFSQVLGNSKLAGLGAAFLVGTGSFQSRIEVGSFAGETLIQAGVQISAL